MTLNIFLPSISFCQKKIGPFETEKNTLIIIITSDNDTHMNTLRNWFFLQLFLLLNFQSFFPHKHTASRLPIVISISFNQAKEFTSFLLSLSFTHSLLQVKIHIFFYLSYGKHIFAYRSDVFLGEFVPQKNKKRRKRERKVFISFLSHISGEDSVCNKSWICLEIVEGHYRNNKQLRNLSSDNIAMSASLKHFFA